MGMSPLTLLLCVVLLLAPAAARGPQKACIRRLRNLDDVSGSTVCVITDDATADRLLPDQHANINLTLYRSERLSGCQFIEPKPMYRGKMLALLSNTCSLAKMMKNARMAGAAALLVVANLTHYPARIDIGSDPKAIPVVVIARNLYSRLLANNTRPELRTQLLPALDTGRGLAPILVFFGITFICLVGGMWLSVHGLVDVNHNLMIGSPRQRSPSEEPLTGINGSSSLRREPPEQKDCGNCASTVGILFLLVISVVSLLLLYFFYDIFVWVIIVMICLVFTTAFKSLVMEAFVRLCRAHNEACTITFRRPILKHLFGNSVDVRAILILPVCAIPAILWLVFRKDFNVWIIQDLCGIVGCIYIIKTIRFGSLKMITIFVVLFFVYDIFMVYITPLFVQTPPEPGPASGFAHPLWQNTSHRVRRSADDGMSVMESVATGSAGKSGEKLPILFLLPLFNFDGSYSLSYTLLTYRPCYHASITMLGFGDIIVPGILLSYAYWCDWRLQSSDRRFALLYSIVGLIGYEVGLGLVYVLLYVMNSGQPALLMLIPCTLLPFLLAAVIRGDFRRVWEGIAPPSAPTSLFAEVDGPPGEGEIEDSGLPAEESDKERVGNP